MSNTTTETGYTKKDIPDKVGKVGLGLLVAGIIVAAISFLVDSNRGAYNSLIVFMYLVSLSVGPMFWVAVEYAAGAKWAAPLRRVLEIMAYMIPFVLIFAIPVVLNMHNMYEWTHEEVVKADPFLLSKSPYLNLPFFFIRVALVFGAWTLFSRLILKNSVKQDETKDPELTRKNVKLSIAFIPIFAFGLTIVAIDWVMSLQPHWYSTMFGVYYFAGTAWAGMAVSTIAVVYLRENGYLHPKMVKDHYYSMGALMFAFTVFWSYIAFGQFLIIYSANIPEETMWYLFRWEGVWKALSLILILLHFIIPFFVLLARPAKMNVKVLKFSAIFILCVHYYDMYWLIMPVYNQESPVFGWMELGFISLAVGFVITMFTSRAKKVNLVAIGDPKLERGLDFRL